MYLILMFLVATTNALIAYDCSSPNASISVINLNHIDGCMINDESTKSESVYVQILKEQDIRTITYIECKIQKSSIITHCGMHSHTSMYRKSLRVLEPVEISSGSCQDAYNYRMYTTPYMHKITNLKINTTNYVSINELGSIDEDGKCDGTTFTHGDATYRDAMMISHYAITLTKKTAVHRYVTSSVIFSDGTSCEYGGGSCTLQDHQLASWVVKPVKSLCGDNIYTILFEGYANITRSSTSPNVLTVETSIHRFAMALTSESILCGHTGYETGDESIIVISGRPGSLPSHQQQEAIDVNVFHNMDLKLIYLERNIANKTTDLYRLFYMRYCKLNRDHHYSLLSMARSNPEEFAWVYTKKPGHTAVLRGEVLYLVKCNPVRVDILPYTNCYQELRVVDSYNTTWYVKPTTKILTRVGTRIVCSSLMPSLFNVDGPWISVNKDINIVESPKQISSADDIPWTYGPLVSLSRLGVLTTKQVNEYRMAILSPIEQSPIISGFATTVTRSDGQHGILVDYSAAYDSSQITEHITQTIFYRLYGWWDIIIRNLAGIVGFAIVWNLALSLLSIILNLILLYNRYGFSSVLVFALWSAMTKHILYGNIFDKLKMRYKAKRRKEVNMEEPTAPAETEIQLKDMLYPLLHQNGNGNTPIILNQSTVTK